LAAGLIDRQWVGTAVGFGLDVGYPDILGAAAIREDYLTVGVESPGMSHSLLKLA
jgi:hypothetical protein